MKIIAEVPASEKEKPQIKVNMRVFIRHGNGGFCVMVIALGGRDPKFDIPSRNSFTSLSFIAVTLYLLVQKIANILP